MSLVYRLSFTLPPVLAFSVPAGRHRPCLSGCMLWIADRGEVVVTGPSREAVFDQAARFFRIVAKGHTLSIEAVLATPGSEGLRSASDSYTITLNAEITFAASTRAPEIFPRAAPRPYRTARRSDVRWLSKFNPTFV